MSAFAAKMGDRVLAVDIHIVLVPSPTGPTPTPLLHPFTGTLSSDLSQDVFVEGKPAAILGSKATNSPPHIPTPPGTSFQKPPSNQATIMSGSTSVLINGKPAARNGDIAMTCNNPTDLPSGKVIAAGTVIIG